MVLGVVRLGAFLTEHAFFLVSFFLHGGGFGCGRLSAPVFCSCLLLAFSGLACVFWLRPPCSRTSFALPLIVGSFHFGVRFWFFPAPLPPAPRASLPAPLPPWPRAPLPACLPPAPRAPLPPCLPAWCLRLALPCPPPSLRCCRRLPPPCRLPACLLPAPRAPLPPSLPALPPPPAAALPPPCRRPAASGSEDEGKDGRACALPA